MLHALKLSHLHARSTAAASINNSPAERTLRRVVWGRCSSPFARGGSGDERITAMYGLIGTTNVSSIHIPRDGGAKCCHIGAHSLTTRTAACPEIASFNWL